MDDATPLEEQEGPATSKKKKNREQKNGYIKSMYSNLS